MGTIAVHEFVSLDGVFEARTCPQLGRGVTQLHGARRLRPAGDPGAETAGGRWHLRQRRLFPEGTPRIPLALIAQETFDNGVAHATYGPSPAP